MLNLLRTQIVWNIILSCILIFFINSKDLKAFMIGSFLGFLNLALLAFIWKNIFEKKNIALTVSIIVIKYAFLIVILYYALQVFKVDALWFALGSGSIVCSALHYGVKEAIKEEVKNHVF